MTNSIDNLFDDDSPEDDSSFNSDASFDGLDHSGNVPLQPTRDDIDADDPSSNDDEGETLDISESYPPSKKRSGSHLGKGDSIGRFQIIRLVGEGGFGQVYEAFDPTLKRTVAIKVAKADRFIGERAWEEITAEGQAVANLTHQSIIRVHDIQRSKDGTPFVVMEFVKGKTLAKYVAKNALSVIQTLTIIREIAEGLQHAHQHSIVHRDLKPANIIIEKKGMVRIADFGLALNVNIPLRKISRKAAGTLSYMSPEQLRAENHRLDGRTDIWALGVITYWMFAGKKPFRAESIEDFAEEICERDPIPIRQTDQSLPIEVDRIVAKCLEKLMSDRYPTAADLIDDIDVLINDLESSSNENGWGISSHRPPVQTDSKSGSSLNSSSSQSSRTQSDNTAVPSKTSPVPDILPIRVVPKGLRSFDAGDTEFFLNLLPGAKDRDGIPDSIRFWVRGLSGKDDPLPIGLIYGPSGCGKSSFVRAGLIPRLSREFTPVYVQASPDRTLKDLTTKLQTIVSNSGESDLETLLLNIRLGRVLPGQRVLIVLDQFEQWLHANPIESRSRLVEALRQADGKSLQVLLLVRDDYWMPVQELFRLLDMQIQDGRNSASLPLFDERHSRKVLVGFGQAYETLPDEETQLSDDQKKFVRLAVDSLKNRGRVVCGHLAMFADMLQAREWTSDEFHRIGGWQGVGVQYLEENFGEDTAPKANRHHSQRIREVLNELLPEPGSKLKGSGRSREELIAACPSLDDTQFDDVARILESNTRVVTQSDPELVSTESNDTQYQLAHDILVDPIRNWINLNQQQNWRGRATIKLDEFVAHHRQMPGSKYVPSLPDYLRITKAVPPPRRSDEANLILKRTRNRIVVRAVGLAAAVALIAGCFMYVKTPPPDRDGLTNRFERFARGTSTTVDDDLVYLTENRWAIEDEIAKFSPTTIHEKIRRAMLRRQRSPQSDTGFDFVTAKKFEGDMTELTGDLKLLIDHLDVAHPTEFRSICNWIKEGSENSSDGSFDKSLLKVLSHNSTADPFSTARLAIFGINVYGFSKMQTSFFETVRDRDEAVTREKPLGNATQSHVMLHEFGNLFDANQENINEFYACGMKANSWGQGTTLQLVLETRKNWTTEFKNQITSDVIALYGGKSDSKFRRSESAYLHSICKHFLLQLKRDVTDVNFGEVNLSGLPEINQDGICRAENWFSLTDDLNNQTFVSIPSGTLLAGDGATEDDMKTYPAERGDKIEIDDFWICDVEVPRSLYLRFINDKLRKNPNGSATEKWRNDDLSEHVPATDISALDIVDFCNWMSDQLGLQHAMKMNGKIIEIIPDTNGIRIPTVYQLEHACRAGTTTQTFVGRFESGLRVMERFANTFQSGKESQLSRSGLRMCNPWGLFDTLGNASEYCLGANKLGSSNSLLAISGLRSRGLSCQYASGEYSSSSGSAYQAQSGFRKYGLRDHGLRLVIPNPPEANE